MGGDRRSPGQRGFCAVRLLGGQEAEAVANYQESAVEVRQHHNTLSSSGTLQRADFYL
jgi:hypothetical protein